MRRNYEEEMLVGGVEMFNTLWYELLNTNYPFRWLVENGKNIMTRTSLFRRKPRLQ